jgi:TPR repeat protein
MTRWFSGIAMLLVFTVFLWAEGTTPLVAAEPECPEGDGWIPCQAQKGDPVAMYVMGRRAYDEARQSGDFTAALNWSHKVVATRHPSGDRLLKMVYLQLGWGAHKDYPQAYVWLSEAIAGGDDYLVAWRKMLMEKMTPEQLAQARKRAGN